jgi:mono/diheme cytochrome c family protein
LLQAQAVELRPVHERRACHGCPLSFLFHHLRARCAEPQRRIHVFFCKTPVGARKAFAVLALLSIPAASHAAESDAQRGLYISKAAGCAGCHTEAVDKAVPYAGGRALETPFGTFYGPNITPHPEAGIGRWTEADFTRALRHGTTPGGSSYYPAFPYPSFTGMSDQDMRDLWAYLQTLPPSDRKSRPHDLRMPYSFRPLNTFWKMLFFKPGPLASDPNLNDVQNRGRYLVQALGHCGECHTPRNFLGAPIGGRYLAGGKGASDKKIPSITPARLKSWSDADLKHFFATAELPDGDTVSESMAEVVRNTTSQLTPQDLEAMIAYLRVVPVAADEAQKK